VKLMNAKYDQDLTVTNESINLTGMVTGNIHVGEDGYLQLHGMILGDITISDRGIVKLHGMVDGSVNNLGGVLEVYGMVEGKVLHQGGRTTYYKGAVVDGKAIPTDRIVGAEIMDR